MDRLTMRINGVAIMTPEHEEKHTMPEWIDMLHERLAAYEDTGYTPEVFDRLCREMSYIRTALGISTYEQLREVAQGSRLIALPCPIGSTVYSFDEIVDVDLCEKCPNFCWGGMGDPNECSNGVSGFRAPKCITISEETATLKSIYWWLYIGAFGKSVFLSREAAEKALAERIANG